MTIFLEQINQLTEQLCGLLETLPLEQKVEALNEVRQKLHQVSPFKNEPVDCVVWVKQEVVEGNDYNPNHVAHPEMKLLELSITQDGYTQPIVGFETEQNIEVVDGFHRTIIGKKPKMAPRLKGYLPLVIINTGRGDIKDRMAATIRHNRARGVHGVSPMTDIVANLLRQGWSDQQVAKELGMDADEVLRFKHHSGLPELFKKTEYSQAWE